MVSSFLVYFTINKNIVARYERNEEITKLKTKEIPENNARVSIINKKFPLLKNFLSIKITIVKNII